MTNSAQPVVPESAREAQPENAKGADSLALADRRWSWKVLLLWTGAILLFTALVDGQRPWEDAILLSLLVLTTGGGLRSVAFVSAIILNWASESTLQWPTYFICLTPLAWVWRSAPGRWWIWEAFLIGFVMAWFGAAFIRYGLPHNGLIAHAGGCCCHGLQWIGIGLGLRLTRRAPPLAAAFLSALLATGCEILQAVYGVTWVFFALALPAAPTPLAQWADRVTIFGVSCLLYLINFLCVPDLRAADSKRWLPPLAAAALLAFAWVGGLVILSRTEVEPLPFSALIVQPDGLDLSGVSSLSFYGRNDREETLRSLTTTALAETPAVDLVVWPASSVDKIIWPDVPISRADFPRDSRIALLFGAPVFTVDGAHYTSGCLIRPDDTLSRHDKVILVPLVETLPCHLDATLVDYPILQWFGYGVHFQAGDYRVQEFTTSAGRPVRLGVGICYEMSRLLHRLFVLSGGVSLALFMLGVVVSYQHVRAGCTACTSGCNVPTTGKAAGLCVGACSGRYCTGSGGGCGCSFGSIGGRCICRP